MREPVTVLLGRLDELIRRGLREVLCEDPSVRVLDPESCGATCEPAGELSAPYVLVVDEASVPEPTALQRLRASRGAIGVIVLTSDPTGAYRQRMLGGGVFCVCKDAAASDILVAVHLAAVARRPPVTQSLTARETEVLGCLSLGYSYAETAHALCIGVETVRTHSARIRGKLGVRSKHELVAHPGRSPATTWRTPSRQGRNGTSKSLQKITP